MASTPHRVVQFLVWCSASGDNRDDAVTTLIDGFADTEERFGPVRAHIWAYGQALKSIPFGAIVLVLKIGSIIWKWGS